MPFFVYSNILIFCGFIFNLHKVLKLMIYCGRKMSAASLVIGSTCNDKRRKAFFFFMLLLLPLLLPAFSKNRPFGHSAEVGAKLSLACAASWCAEPPMSHQLFMVH